MVLQSLIESYGNEKFGDLDMTHLKIDSAYLIITNLRNEDTFLYSRYKDCIKCPRVDRYGNLSANKSFAISTEYQEEYKVVTQYVDMLPFESNENVLCDLDTKFEEFGVYHLTINGTKCSVDTLKEPVNIYLSILTVLIIYFLLFALTELYKCLLRRINLKRNSGNIDNGSVTTTRERVKSLDAIRGITIALMVFVNYGGGSYKFIEHAIWNGLHIADIVFPWFLWIMGVCIPMSIKSTIKTGTPTGKALLRIARRSITLFLIGLFLGGGAELSTIRIFGVLQRFGISYFVVATICLLIMKHLESTEDVKLNKIKAMFSDVVKIGALWTVAFVITAIHITILFTVPFGECPSGYLGPGGYHDNATYLNCTGGITGYVDRLILGKHMYQYAEIRRIYNAQTFDPEGILGCLPSIVQVIIGVQAGVTLMTFKDHKSRLTRWFAWALVLAIIGGGLCGFSKESGIIPLNKNLWSLSFVLVTSSFAFLLLFLCYVLVDITKYWSGKPFLYAGMNAIVVYIGHSLVYDNFPVRWQWNYNNTHFLRLLENVWATAAWLFISYLLYRKKWFFTI